MNMKKTKIICTVGPATENDDVLRGMIDAGMNVARFNFSHGTHESHKKAYDQLKRIREEMGVHIGSLLDTKGPDVRLEKFKDGEATLEEGQLFTLHSGEYEGDSAGCKINYNSLAYDVEVGAKILFDDGSIESEVVEIKGSDIICKIKNGGVLKNNKGVNIPGVRLSMPYMSDKDREDICFGIENGFDFIAASFVSRKQDVLDIRRVLERHNCDSIQIIAKIENAEGVDNIEEILEVSDGIMVARGDMGVEIDLARLPSIQKKLIGLCYNSGKPVITATQMLESMIGNVRPTRAEVSDVANAVYDRTSAVMLSGETTIGRDPVNVVRTMAEIIYEAENSIEYTGNMFRRRSDSRFGTGRNLSIAEAACHAACITSMETEATAILAVSRSGETARMLSKYRSPYPIYACVLDDHVARHLSLSWGVYPLVMKLMPNTDEVLKESERLCLKAGLVKDGETVVVIAGLPSGESGTTNMMTIHRVGQLSKGKKA
ncbi:MAG: pyruvate kinase [Oscillospiraceae bacterium]|nr:pyruvate kinase [Oscillospiraceae bacterium]